MVGRKVVGALGRGSLWLYRLVTVLVLAVGLLFAGIVLGLRYGILPNIDQYRDSIAGALSQAVGERVTVGRVQGEWNRFRPQLELQDVNLYSRDGARALALGKVEATLSWLSLFAGEIRLHRFEAANLNLEIRRDAKGGFHVGGIAIRDDGGEGGLLAWTLEQQHIRLHDSRVTWIDQTRAVSPVALQQVELRIDQLFGRHRFALRATPPIELAAPIDLRGDLYGRSGQRWSQWRGQLYLDVDYSDVGALASRLALPVEISQGAGGVRLWLEIRAGGLRAVHADLALTDVRTRLRPDLPELNIASLSGQLGWRQQSGLREISARRLTFRTSDGLQLSPADIRYLRRQDAAGQPTLTQLGFDRVDIAAASRLVDRLPVAEPLRAWLADLKPRGTLREVEVQWRGAWSDRSPYSLRGKFERVSVSPAGKWPGVGNVSGAVDLDQDKGALTLQSNSTTIDLPRLFAVPLPLEHLDARASWVMTQGLPLVRVEQLSVRNQHVAGSLKGSYQALAAGPGRVDLDGNFSRLLGQDAWRYLPHVVDERVRIWLRDSLLSVEAINTRLTLKGNLSDFPFTRPGSGTFEVTADIPNGHFVFGPGWPGMERGRGRLMVRGHRLDITPVEGWVFGTRLSEVTITVPDLGAPDPVLEAHGIAEGPTQEFLRFIHQSPVRRMIGGFSDDMTAQGAGRLSLRMTMPLEKVSDVQLAGSYRFSDNILDPGLDMPRLDQFSGQMDFTRNDITIKQATARVFDSPARFDIDLNDSGQLLIVAHGRTDVPALRTLFDYPALQPMLQQLSGAADWQASVTMRNRKYDYVIESDLVGLGSQLPAPLAKPAQQKAAFRFERRERSAQQEVMSFSYQDVAGQFLLDKGRRSSISRGELRFGERAPFPLRDGLWVSGKLARLDLDRWRQLALPAPVSGTRAGPPLLKGVQLKVGELRAFARELDDFAVKAQYAEGSWAVDVNSTQLSGKVDWYTGGVARVTAQLQRLYLPEPVEHAGSVPRVHVAGEGRNLPAIELQADDFRLGTRQLGQLILSAVPAEQSWRIQRGEVINPDSKLSLTGTWRALAEQPRTDVNLKLEIGNIERYFARMQLPKGIKNGSATVEGKLDWAGPPYGLDVRSLSGNMTLAARKGQFARIEPGIGKLIGVLSLQALPRRVALDFRDVFSQGFSFDEISADVTLASGVASTRNFRMAGTSARVEIKGRMDLAAETQALDVKVIPSLGDTIAIGAALVNPAVGLAALLAQKVLKNPIDQMMAFEYDVTGTWSDPVVVKKKRESHTDSVSGRK